MHFKNVIKKAGQTRPAFIIPRLVILANHIVHARLVILANYIVHARLVILE
jgi:hypothetical protein